LVDRDLRARC